ncbi:replication-relaxation family protein, partial [Kutzneria sp. NPDC052558]|uniref:replication-relaxation family protein n=1 Tax=Kutzneria sp. NPDC052558 TaxID=3364121 RepID=UPI0037C6028C
SVVTPEHLAWLARRLTARDRWLARMLREHRVLTSRQIVQMAFTGVRSANRRLRELFQWRMIDRFQPFVTVGSAPMHYVLDIAGAHLLAHEDGLDPQELRYRHEVSIGIAHSLRLAHTVAVNGHFATLIAHARTTDHTRLTAWWSETRCRKHFGDLARPDAYARWRVHDTELEFFLEFDFGTENLRILASKLGDYEKLALTTAITAPLLIRFTSTAREATARRALTDALDQLDHPDLVPIATGTTASPVVPAWLPINGADTTRLQLIDLARNWPALAPADAPTASAQLAPPSPMPPASSPAPRG